MGFMTAFSKSLSKPSKVTSIGPYGAPSNLKAITGVKKTTPFKDAVNNFGSTARKGLKGLTTVRKGR